jgi:putative membrane protein
LPLDVKVLTNVVGSDFGKKESVMKRIGIVLSAGVFALLVAGARGDGQGKLPLDNDFLVKEATCHFAVISVSKMAETQGSPDVKSFAVQLGKDHQAAYEKLAGLLKTRKVGVVSGTEADTKATIKRLGELKGTDFDREYLKWTIGEHREGISLQENQIKMGKDADVGSFAKECLSTSRKHLEKAEELAKSIKAK